MKSVVLVTVVVVLVALLASCAPGANAAVGSGDDVAGFWLGLWHGFIALFTFVISLFKDNVSMYEVNNNGGWYNFGYLLGVMTFWGSGGRGAAGATRSK